jgi:D-threo-aldose 1-dehydrogenase
VDPTRRVRLGRTGVEVSQLGVGTNPLGGLYEPVSPTTAKSVIDRAYDAGLRFFDTAPVYGYGNAERNVGAALRGHPRADYVLTTKVGRLLLDAGLPEREDVMVLWEGEQLYKGTERVRPYFDFSYDGAMRSVEDSLNRTGTDRFDLLHIHDPDLYPDEALDGAFKALDRLRSEGTIGGIGAGSNQWEVLAEFARRADFDCFLLAGRYTLLDQSALHTLLPLCVERQIAIIAGGVYNSGILSHPDPGSIADVGRDSGAIGSWTSNVTYNYVPAGAEIIARAARIKEICDTHAVPLMAAAIQFPMHHPAVPTVLMGPRNPEQVDGNIAAFSVDIPAALWSDLKSEGIVRPEAPTP